MDDDSVDRIAAFRRHLAASEFIPLKDVDPQLARRVSERLASEFLANAAIADAHIRDVVGAIAIETGNDVIRVTLGDLGTVTESWDGSTDDLDSIADERARGFSDTYKEDRGRHGDAPWG